MVAKNELLSDLADYLEVEEDIINNLSAFFQHIGWRKVINAEYHSHIEEGLKALQEDTKKHIRMLKEMENYIKGSDQNEF